MMLLITETVFYKDSLPDYILVKGAGKHLWSYQYMRSHKFELNPERIKGILLNKRKKQRYLTTDLIHEIHEGRALNDAFGLNDIPSDSKRTLLIRCSQSKGFHIINNT